VEIITASHKDLPRIAHCHIRAFPASLSSLLGPRYAAKMLEWYLTSDNKFLFHIEMDGRVVGYCGGFVRKGEPYGSSSGMTQYAFREGIRALLLRPWLVFHPKVRGNFRFLGRNLWYRVFPPRAQPAAGDNSSHSRVSTPLNDQQGSQSPLSAGLVVIGVDPGYQGKGLGSLLLQEFERRALAMGCRHMHLTVEKENAPAIRAYERNGWQVVEIHGASVRMKKTG
jgi:ribosomal protein S18 acetylase RimI-like enzyme